jgi:allantoin racemase
MHQSHSYLAANLPVPVLNPGVIAYKMCEILLDLGISHSKTAFPNPEVIKDEAFRI